MNESYDRREASHAGTWYSDNLKELKTELESYINQAKVQLPIKFLKAIISPFVNKSCWIYVQWIYSWLGFQCDEIIFLED